LKSGVQLHSAHVTT